MKKSNQEKGAENAKILREYIEKNTSFPMSNGQLNKSKLLKELGIPSARQRPECENLLKELDEDIAKNRNGKAYEAESDEREENSKTIKTLRSCINALQQKLALTEAQLDAYRRNEVSELLLVKTGKILPTPFNPLQEPLDLQKTEY